MKVKGKLSTTVALGLALSLVVLVSFVSQDAYACELAKYSNNGRYIGGGLITQIVKKSNTIQIVRVTEKYLLRRTYAKGERYLQFGDLDVTKGSPEYIDEFVFKLTPVDTLKSETNMLSSNYNANLRVRGYSFNSFLGFSTILNKFTGHPNDMPDWMYDRPANNGYLFIGASTEAIFNSSACESPYMLEVGQTLVAFRDSMGRLYPDGGAFPLEIDVDFSTAKKKNRFKINMQSLVPVSGANDKFVVALKQALATKTK